MVENNAKHPTKHNALIKTGIARVIVGLLGGGVACAGLFQVNGQNASQASVVSMTKVEKSSSKGNSQMTNVFNTVKKSVVSAVSLKRQSSPSDSGPFGISDSDNSSSSKKNSKFDLETYNGGPGVIYMRSNGRGYVVTNNHVVSGSDEIQVVLGDGKKVTAKKVGTDSKTDLVVLTIDGKYITRTVQFGSSKNLEPGQQVIAVGSSLGSGHTTSVTQDIISAKNRTVNVTNFAGQVTNRTTVIQIDTAVSPSNSGGPFVSMSGQVIRINSMKLSLSSDGTAAEDMGFTIPGDEVASIISQLVKNGKITRPKLGVGIVSVDELTEYGCKKLGLPDSVKSGVYAVGVTKNGSVDKVEAKPHDVIIKISGKVVNSVVSLYTAPYIHKVDDTVTLQAVRDGKSQDVKVTLN